MKLIRSPDGSEMCLVNSTRGHDGWTVLSENIEAKPKKWERWNGHAFEEDAQEKRRHENEAKAKDGAQLLSVIEELSARVRELEGKLANQAPL